MQLVATGGDGQDVTHIVKGSARLLRAPVVSVASIAPLTWLPGGLITTHCYEQCLSSG